jgi:glycosyltransferase involved in cell wall biosynthesis
MKKVSILAAFPLHHLKAFGEKFRPKEHYATWLPQISESWEGQHEIEIHWVVMSDQVNERRDLCQWGQIFHILPTSKCGRASTLFWEDRKAIGALLDEIQPDLVHGWGTEDVYGLATVLSGRRNIVSMQGILSYYAFKNIMPFRTYLQAALEIFILWKAQQLTIESEWGCRVLHRRSPLVPIEIIEYGVQQVFLKTKWMPDKKKSYALFVGGISPRKGIQDLVEAFKDARLFGQDLFVIGGKEGEWSGKLQKRAPHNIRWLGRKSPSQIAKFMSRARCLVLPTRADTSPNVVKEARVVGLPIITTREGGQSSYIRDGEDGYFVKCGDVEALIEKLTSLLRASRKKGQKANECRKKHRNNLLPKKTAISFYKLYKKILKIPITNNKKR